MERQTTACDSSGLSDQNASFRSETFPELTADLLPNETTETFSEFPFVSHSDILRFLQTWTCCFGAVYEALTSLSVSNSSINPLTWSLSENKPFDGMKGPQAVLLCACSSSSSGGESGCTETPAGGCRVQTPPHMEKQETGFTSVSSVIVRISLSYQLIVFKIN